MVLTKEEEEFIREFRAKKAASAEVSRNNEIVTALFKTADSLKSKKSDEFKKTLFSLFDGLEAEIEEWASSHTSTNISELVNVLNHIFG